jgi:hypothetical protein
VWSNTTKVLVAVLAALLLLIIVGLVSTCFGYCVASAMQGHGPLQIPVSQGCPVPSGGSIDICSIVTAGAIHCPINLPDLNPADWLTWFGCSIGQDAGAIWNAIVGDVGTFIVGIVNELVAATSAGFNGLLDTVGGAITSAVSWFANIVVTFWTDVAATAAPLGPLAPVLTVTVVAGVFIAAIVALYFVTVALFAIGKTLFNLL